MGHADAGGGGAGKEYAIADDRWDEFDATLVSLELMTVLVVAPLCVLALYGTRPPMTPAAPLTGPAPRRAAMHAGRSGLFHFAQIIISTAELYGGAGTAAQEGGRGRRARMRATERPRASAQAQVS